MYPSSSAKVGFTAQASCLVALGPSERHMGVLAEPGGSREVVERPPKGLREEFSAPDRTEKAA